MKENRSIAVGLQQAGKGIDIVIGICRGDEGMIRKPGYAGKYGRYALCRLEGIGIGIGKGIADLHQAVQERRIAFTGGKAGEFL